MNWIEIIITIGSTVGILELIKLIRDWHTQKKVENENAKQEELETTSKNIDVMGKMYEMLSTMAEHTQSEINNRTDAYKQMTSDLTEIKNDIKNLKEDVGYINLYLNGEFREFKSKIDELKK